MSYGLQCCIRCGRLEGGHTGPGDRYLCASCHGAGWRVDSAGNVYPLSDNLSSSAPRVYPGPGRDVCECEHVRVDHEQHWGACRAWVPNPHGGRRCTCARFTWSHFS